MTDENRKTGSERPGPVSVYDIRAACPGLGHAMFVLEAFRIRDLFRHRTLAVLSVFRRDRTTVDNYATQARLSGLLREDGVAYLAAVGRWPGVGTRGLLLREVSQEQTRAWRRSPG